MNCCCTKQKKDSFLKIQFCIGIGHEITYEEDINLAALSHLDLWLTYDAEKITSSIALQPKDMT